MDAKPAKKMRKEDHSQYVDSNRKEISLLHEQVAGYFAKGVAFVKRLVTCEMAENFAKVARPKTFYNQVQKFRPVPRQPHPPELLVELERVRKGFDPIHMTVSRYQKEERERLKMRKEIVDEAKLRRNSENQAPSESTQPRKIFKKMMFFEEKEENRKERWELCEKKFKLVLDTLQEIGEAAESKPNQPSFFATSKAQKEEKPQTIISDSKPQASVGNQSTPLPTIPEDSVENTSDQSTLQADKAEQINVPQVSNQSNPFFSSITKPISLIDLIQKEQKAGSQAHGLFAQFASKTGVSSILSFGSQRNQNSNFSQQNLPLSFQQTSNMNPAPIQLNNFGQSEPSYSQQNPSFFNQGQPNYSTSSFFTPKSLPKPAPTNNHFTNGITNSKLSNANPADFFRSPNNSSPSQLFQTSSNRTQKKEKGYRHSKKGTELRVQ